jgi:hypothetical protein
MINVDKLFDFIKVIFAKDDTYDKLTLSDKSKHTFMLNRFMSIKYPIQASLFNMIKTNSVGISDSWRMVAKQFGRVPGWIYTKTKKNSVKKEKSEYEPSEEAISEYMRITEIGHREFTDAMKLCPDELKKQLYVLDTYLAGYSKEKK